MNTAGQGGEANANDITNVAVVDSQGSLNGCSESTSLDRPGLSESENASMELSQDNSQVTGSQRGLQEPLTPAKIAGMSAQEGSLACDDVV